MKIEDKGIKEEKNWCKSDLVKDIKFFLALYISIERLYRVLLKYLGHLSLY